MCGTQCFQTIEIRASFKAWFVDLLVLYRFLIISKFHVWILVQLVMDLVKNQRKRFPKIEKSKTSDKKFYPKNFFNSKIKFMNQNENWHKKIKVSNCIYKVPRNLTISYQKCHRLTRSLLEMLTHLTIKLGSLQKKMRLISHIGLFLKAFSLFIPENPSTLLLREDLHGLLKLLIQENGLIQKCKILSFVQMVQKLLLPIYKL